jgi:hypothetical protein
MGYKIQNSAKAEFSVLKFSGTNILSNGKLFVDCFYLLQQIFIGIR